MNNHDRTLHTGDGQDPGAVPAFPPPGRAIPPLSPPAPPVPAAPDLDQLAELVYERLAGQLGRQPAQPEQPEQPGDMPAVDEAVALRERAPELYDLWLKIAQERAATGNYVRRAPYEVPERLAQSGRPRAVSSLIVVLAFCGYLAWLGGPGPYIAGLIAVFDLIVMLGLFFGLRPEHLSGARRPGKKP